MDEQDNRTKAPRRKGCDPQTPGRGNTRQALGRGNDRRDKEASYKTEPGLKNIFGVIEECEKVADKFKVDPPEEIECPIPPEVE